MTKTAIKRALHNIKVELEWLVAEEKAHNPNWSFMSKPYSKRRARLVRTYWALKAMQERSKAEQKATGRKRKRMKVCVKFSNGYVTNFTDKSVTTCHDPARAMVFADAESAKANLPEVWGREYKYINAGRVKARANWHWIIMVQTAPWYGEYVWKSTPKRTRTRSSPDDARKFATKAAAEKYILSLKAKHSKVEFVAVDMNELG